VAPTVDRRAQLTPFGAEVYPLQERQNVYSLSTFAYCLYDEEVLTELCNTLAASLAQTLVATT
jgi:hypothetical protein